MYKTFRHGGKIGDVIFSLPTIRELGGGILYLPERTPDACNNLYSSLKDLLLLQPYIHEVREYPSGLPYMKLAPGIHIDYDLDRARDQPNKGLTHIVKRYMDAFGVKYANWKEPWLKVDVQRSMIGPNHIRHSYGNYSVLNYTGRHTHNDKMNITSDLDWAKVCYDHKGSTLCFVGHEGEYQSFYDKYLSGVRGVIKFVPTLNMLEVAAIISGAEKVYCNQSSVLALSQALGKTYYLEPKPMKRNCLLETPNENILI